MVPLVFTLSRTRALEAERANLEAQIAAHTRRRAEQESRLAELQRELGRERSRAARLASALADSPRARGVLTLLLGAAVTRGGEEAPRLELQPDTALVELVLPVAATTPGPYRASLETPDGERLWESDELAARQADRRRTVRVAIDPQDLPSGHLVAVLVTAGLRRK